MEEQNVLHVEEGMEERVNESGGENHEAWQVRLHGGIDIIILVRRDLEVLLKLTRSRKREDVVSSEYEARHTLNRFFSSLRDFSFLSRSFVNELLYRS